MAEDGYTIKFRMKAACERVTGFRFDKPAGYEFQAGQYLRLTIPTAEGSQTKPLSHASAPQDPFIEMAARMSGSAFKNALAALVRGDEVHIDGPYGKLVMRPGIHKAAFLAGGVGIAPCRSMIRDAVQRRTGLRMRLFYGNHDQVCIPYSGEFAEYERKDRRFQVVHILEDPLPGWAGERGLITPDLLKRYIDDPLDGWHYFVAGPPAMAESMKQVLAALGIAENAQSFEHFIGYA